MKIKQNGVDLNKALIIYSYKPATSLLILDDSSSSLIGMTYSLAVSINIRKRTHEKKTKASSFGKECKQWANATKQCLAILSPKGLHK